MSQANTQVNVLASRISDSKRADYAHQILDLTTRGPSPFLEILLERETHKKMFLGIIRGACTELPPPVETMRGLWSALEEQQAQHKLYYSAVGSPETVRRELRRLIEQTGADEIIATAQIFDHAARLHSFEIAAEVFRDSSLSSTIAR